jgi:AcrR family transcriptional regulator
MTTMPQAPSPESGPRQRPFRGRPRGPTQQGQQTRDLLYQTALRLMAERGLEATTLRDIAAEAGVSPGLLYRYFTSKEAVLIALHNDLSGQHAAAAVDLPAGPWRRRVLHVARLSLQVLGPQRPVLAALTSVLLSGREGGLLSAETAPARQRVQTAFVRAVVEATDAPADTADCAALARLSYAAHLAILLWWLLDRSPQQRATSALLELTERALPGLALVLRLPPARRWMRQFDELATDGLGL